MNKTLHRIAAAAAFVGATGATVLTAAPAQAANDTVWDRVAQCESGQRWNINTGNGYYGGLQFSRSTWNGFGGQQFAARADLATRAQQITVAQRVLKVQGPGAWPICSRRAGLTKANGLAVSVSTSTPPAPKPAVTKPAVKPRIAAASAPRGTVKNDKALAAKMHVVKAGDTLSRIARDHGTTWQQLWALNKAQISNPNLIYIGQHVSLG